MMDYLEWESGISLQQVFADSESFSYPQPGRHGLVYLSQLRSEGGGKSRSALMLLDRTEAHLVTPVHYSLRTTVSEYGGKPYWLFDDTVYFANQSDQCLYRQILEDGGATKPVRITPAPDDNRVFMYTDVLPVSHDLLLAIVEESRPQDPDKENLSYVASIDPATSEIDPVKLVGGADFYSNLVLDSKRLRIAWVEWNHPSMPWDANAVWLGQLALVDGALEVVSKQRLDLPESACACQLLFASTGTLFLSVDYTSAQAQSVNGAYWNVHVVEPGENKAKRITDAALEFGYPHWQYGDQRIVQHDSNAILTIGSSPEGDKLFRIDVADYSVTEEDLGARFGSLEGTLQSLASDGHGTSALIHIGLNHGPSLLTLRGDHLSPIIERPAPQRTQSQSLAEHITYPTDDGQQAYGFYYPPSNHEFGERTDTGNNLPPLIVLVHGGPTARAYGHFDIQKQFWTSRGFALFDVNHRGSSGYGRDYRDALYGHWGVLDVSDVINGISWLVDQGRVDAERVCIRGKSAGGYAVLRALSEYPDVFRAGACYYGIGNLVTLAASTHKFEKHYTDRLIGEAYSPVTANSKDSQYFKRSPINKMSKLKSAMIVFQGALDNVVPPAVAQEIIDSLKIEGVDHSYVEYPDEGHGFRQVDNNIDAWSRELAFYRRVLAK